MISFKFSFPVIPESIRRCAPANVIYPPTVPPSNVRIAGKISLIDAVGMIVSFAAIPTGGCTIRITIKMTRIMIPPRIFVRLSIAFNAFFDKNTMIAIAPAIKYPTVVGIPRSVLKPKAPPPTLPILNTRPPATTKNAITYPSPGSTLFATSCPRIPDTHRTLHTFNCTIAAKITDIKITNPKLPCRLSVNLPVCVRNPGPIAEVAIRNAAPIKALALFLLFSFFIVNNFLSFS